MTTSNNLAPLGETLDSVLQRLENLEKFADGNNDSYTSSNTIAPKVISPPTPATSPSIQSLQAQVADLRNQLEASERQCKRLELQLSSAGIKIAEDIPYEVAKSKVKEIAVRMQEIGSSNVEVAGDKEKQKQLREEYYNLELEMEKYNTALCTSNEYLEEGRNKESQWEMSIKEDNRLALLAIRRQMPVDIKNYSEAQLTEDTTPNGKNLPKVIARKFKRCNVLQIIRMDPTAIVRLHPASLENYPVNGMTLTERRAVYSHLTDSKTSSGMTIVESWAKKRKDEMVDRKFVWYTMMRDNLKSTLSTYLAHVAKCGPPDKHECDLIGNQCPVRADRNTINYYEEDYGYPEEDVYAKVEQAASISLSAAPEKMADPSQLSEDRVKEELKNRKRIAYQDWRNAHEKESKDYTEHMAEMEVKVEELVIQVQEYKADEIENTEEHKKLKEALSALPRGSKDRLPTMKQVNVCQTQKQEAKNRCEAATEELTLIKSKLEKEKETGFICSVSKPNWDENGDGGEDSDVNNCTPTPSPPSSNGEIDFRRLSLKKVDSSRGSKQSIVNGGGPTRKAPGGLLAAIQNRGKSIDTEDTTNDTITKPPASNDTAKGTKSTQDLHRAEETVINDSSPNTTTAETRIDKETTYNRKSNSGSQQYIRKGSGTVLRTMLLECPPPKTSSIREAAAEKAQKEEHDAEEKATAKANERANKLQKEREERKIRERNEREEAERLEREKQDKLAKQREEIEKKRLLAKESEKQRKLEEEISRKEEQERAQNDQVAMLEERVKIFEESYNEHNEAMLRCKKELKEIPKGSKDRLTKMKEINQYQMKRGEAKKGLDAAREELEVCLRSK